MTVWQVQGQGLRLDESSEVLPCHRQQLHKVATAAAETLRLAKQLGTAGDSAIGSLLYKETEKALNTIKAP